MRKPKIYLDTSVISHLSQEDVPDKMYDTLQLWEEIKQGHYEAYISETTIDEIMDDCLHIGCAVVNSCNMIISWNFKHIVRVKTINGVRYINSMLGYGDIGIYPPSMIIRGDDFDE